MGPRYQCIDLPAFFGEGVGPLPDRSQKGNAEAEFHRVIPVRPIFLPATGLLLGDNGRPERPERSRLSIQGHFSIQGHGGVSYCECFRESRFIGLRLGISPRVNHL
jgi:hypothetical protein